MFTTIYADIYTRSIEIDINENGIHRNQEVYSLTYDEQLKQ